MKKRKGKQDKKLPVRVVTSGGLVVWTERRDEPDWDKYTTALLALAKQKIEDER